MIEADGLSLWTGGRWVLEALSFAVAPGRCLLITGANGSGKSLLARTVAGLARPSAGRVTIGGVTASRRKARRMVGFLPQDCGLYASLTVDENIAFFAAMAGVRRSERSKVAADLLELVGLASLRAEMVSQLTPGQRQRLAVGRTLAGDHPALVFDEPLQGLDAVGRADLRQLLAELAAMGKAILVTAGDGDGLPYDQQLRLEEGRLKGGEAE